MGKRTASYLEVNKKVWSRIKKVADLDDAGKIIWPVNISDDDELAAMLGCKSIRKFTDVAKAIKKNDVIQKD